MSLLGLAEIPLSIYNNLEARSRTNYDRERNYELNELAANNADKRTRALYEDFYSPAALVKQYNEAGLSPSMMFGGTPGQGGTSGAQGTGTAGPQTPYMPMSLLEAAQAAQLLAQTTKTKAETKNIQQDTILKELEEKLKNIDIEIKGMEGGDYKNTWLITNSIWKNSKTGEDTSIFELAKENYTYEEFLNSLRNGNTDPQIREAMTTEAGQKTLRSIYTAASRLNRDIMVLSEETVAASFQMSVLNALEKVKKDNKNYFELNAEAIMNQLKQTVETAELNTTQKEAWNNLIDKLGKKGSTWRDVVIVLGMILGNFASNTGIKLNFGN